MGYIYGIYALSIGYALSIRHCVIVIKFDNFWGM